MKRCPKCGYVEPKGVRIAKRILREFSISTWSEFAEQLPIDDLNRMVAELRARLEAKGMSDEVSTGGD